MTKPTALNVCWSCKKGDKTLLRLRDENGFKVPDYMCTVCAAIFGLKEPPIGNASKIYFPKEVKKEKYPKKEHLETVPSGATIAT